jgi:enamine deaminase RidA (YjgF/YER057c/UK114 family)
MIERTLVASGTRWEPLVGYSRAIRVGNHVYVSGTTSVDDAGNLVGEGDAHAQTVQVLRRIEAALERCGAKLSDVVRTRIYVLDISQWETIGRAHGQFFSKILPATSMIEVSQLIDPLMLVEIEAEAIVEWVLAGEG